MSAMELKNTVLINNPNLKAYYRFESGAELVDSSGNSNTLSNIGTPTYTTGKFGQCSSLAAASAQAYSMTDSATLKPTGSFSVGAWINIASGTGMYGIFASYNYSTNHYGISFGINQANNNAHKLTCVVGRGAGGVDNIQGTITVDDGAWHLVVWTWDGANHRIYVDSKIDSTTASANAPSYYATNTPRVGCEYNGTGNNKYWNGQLDDVFLFNGIALSPDQIKELYEGRTLGELWPQTGLVALYHLNGNSTDFSGNSNHGTDTAITYSQANGKFNQGAGFNGSSSKIMVADSASVSLTTPYTISMWIKPTALPTSGNLINPLSKYDTGAPGGAGGYEIQLYNNSGTQQINLDHYAASAPLLSTNYTLSTSNWSYFVDVWDGTNFYLYINGNLINSGRTSGTATNPTDNAKSLNIGTFGSLGGTGELGRWFNGAIDELAIFNIAKDAVWVRDYYAWSKGLRSGII